MGNNLEVRNGGTNPTIEEIRESEYVYSLFTSEKVTKGKIYKIENADVLSLYSKGFVIIDDNNIPIVCNITDFRLLKPSEKHYHEQNIYGNKFEEMLVLKAKEKGFVMGAEAIHMTDNQVRKIETDYYRYYNEHGTLYAGQGKMSVRVYKMGEWTKLTKCEPDAYSITNLESAIRDMTNNYYKNKKDDQSDKLFEAFKKGLSQIINRGDQYYNSITSVNLNKDENGREINGSAFKVQTANCKVASGVRKTGHGLAVPRSERTIGGRHQGNRTTSHSIKSGD